MYDAFMWNWSKFAVRDDAIFIASYISEAIGDKVWWPSQEEWENFAHYMARF